MRSDLFPKAGTYEIIKWFFMILKGVKICLQEAQNLAQNKLQSPKNLLAKVKNSKEDKDYTSSKATIESIESCSLRKNQNLVKKSFIHG